MGARRRRRRKAPPVDFRRGGGLRRLPELESGAYWPFLGHAPERTFVGASPERPVTLHAGVATMNPISGTYRYPPAGPTLPDVLGFLAVIGGLVAYVLVADWLGFIPTALALLFGWLVLFRGGQPWSSLAIALVTNLVNRRLALP